MNEHEHIEAIEEIKRLSKIYQASRAKYLDARGGTTEEKNAMMYMDANANVLAQQIKFCLEEGFIK